MKTFFSPGSFITGIVLGVLLAGAWFFDGSFLAVPEPTASVSSAEELEDSPSGAISVADQRAGDTVTVESVTVPPPGVWVAVREMVGTSRGNVLGAARVGGPATGITVPLLRATEPDRRYALECYRDDGDGAFDLATDSAYVDFDTGERVVSYFRTVR